MAEDQHRVPRGEGPSGTTDPTGAAGTADTVIVGGNDETRLLLRGLLRLHRFRVVGETRSAEELDPLAEPLGPRVLLLVVEGEGANWPEELATARERQSGLLPLLIVSQLTPDLESQARAAGVLRILARPFTIRDLIAAVESVARGEEHREETLRTTVSPSAP
jgi:AmiR/NasT family two-component response regulator